MKIYLIILILIPIMVSAYDFSYTINMSKLPFSNSEVINIIFPNSTTIQNSSLSFSYDQFLSGISQVNLTEYVYTANISILIPLLNPDNYTTNLTASILNVSENNITMNLTTTFTWFIAIFNDTLPLNLTDFIQTSENKVTYELCDYNLRRSSITPSPYVTSITSLQGYTIPINCLGFTSCPEQLNFTSPTMPFTINITIPNGTKSGTYESLVMFNLLTSVKNITFVFNVRDCNLPLPDFTQAVLETCKNISDINKYIECTAKLSQYYADLYSSLLDANKTREVNVTQYIQNNKTEFVVVYEPNVSGLLRESYEQASAINRLTVENRGKDTDIKNLRTDVDTWQEKYNILLVSLPTQIQSSVENAISNLYLDNKNLSANLFELQRNSIGISTLFVFLGVLFLVGISVAGYFIYNKYIFY